LANIVKAFGAKLPHRPPKMNTFIKAWNNQWEEGHIGPQNMKYFKEIQDADVLELDEGKECTVVELRHTRVNVCGGDRTHRAENNEVMMFF